MATATADSYTASSGGTVYAGRDTGLPAWRTAMSARTWAQVGSNTVDSLNPRYNAAINPVYPDNYVGGANGGLQAVVVDNWNGACWVEEDLKLYMGPNGGHGDYAGNETYIWDAATGDWSMGKPPSGSIGYSQGITLETNSGDGMYTDGRVRSYHTYSNHSSRDGVAWFFGGSVYSEGAGTLNKSRLWKWDSGALDWADQSGSVIDGNIGGGACYDASRDRFWLSYNGLAHYAPLTNTFTQLATNINAPSGPGYIRPVYDPVRDCLLMFSSAGDGTGAKFSVVKLSSGTPATGVQITPTGTAPTDPSRGLGVAGSVYDSDNDRYLVWRGGTSVYVLTPPSALVDPTVGTWAWSALTPSGGSVNPGSEAYAGTYGRFWYSSTLRACGVFNSTVQKMQVFALS